MRCISLRQTRAGLCGGAHGARPGSVPQPVSERCPPWTATGPGDATRELAGMRPPAAGSVSSSFSARELRPEPENKHVTSSRPTEGLYDRWACRDPSGVKAEASEGQGEAQAEVRAAGPSLGAVRPGLSPPCPAPLPALSLPHSGDPTGLNWGVPGPPDSGTRGVGLGKGLRGGSQGDSSPRPWARTRPDGSAHLCTQVPKQRLLTVV